MGYLPGQRLRPVKKGVICDHWDDSSEDEDYAGCEKQAVVLVIGETDSFGSEHEALCEEHDELDRKRVENWRSANPIQHCDWCKKGKKDCQPRRDWEESSGPVYTVCPDCWARSEDAARRELEAMEAEEYW